MMIKTGKGWQQQQRQHNTSQINERTNQPTNKQSWQQLRQIIPRSNGKQNSNSTYGEEVERTYVRLQSKINLMNFSWKILLYGF